MRPQRELGAFLRARRDGAELAALVSELLEASPDFHAPGQVLIVTPPNGAA